MTDASIVVRIEIFVWLAQKANGAVLENYDHGSASLSPNIRSYAFESLKKTYGYANK